MLPNALLSYKDTTSTKERSWTNMDNKRVLEKVRRLLALSDKTKNESEAEAEAALLKAHELMAKYDITMDEASEEKVAYVNEVCSSKWNMGFRKPLAVIIAQNFRCETYLRGSGGSVVFFGHATDARIAKEVFEYAYKFAMKEGNRMYNENYQTGRPTQGVFNSYVNGFLIGLKTKLGEQSTALMVVTPADVKETFENMSKEFKQSSGGMRQGDFDRDAYTQGIQDGKTVMNGRRLKDN